tara:strand:+ start:2783 stop:2893 length:111 start_codon:yes stop_codon:yes gene_type:complete
MTRKTRADYENTRKAKAKKLKEISKLRQELLRRPWK